MNARIIKLCAEDYGDSFFDSELVYLDSRKRERALSYKFGRDRKNCILGDYALRRLVSSETGCAIEKVRLSSDGNGSPFVLYPAGTGLSCSVSHSGSMVVAAVSSVPVGIDIEQIKVDDIDVTSQVCNERELSYLCENASDPAAFFRIWTVKEAYLKCIGTGITDISDLRKVDSFELPQGYAGEQDESIRGFVISLVTWNGNKG